MDYADSIDYVYIEMVFNQLDKNEIVSGLFKGITTKDGFTFILLQGKQEGTNVVNLKFYNIMTIEVLRKKYKDLTYLTIDKEEQKIGFDMLNKLYDELKPLHINSSHSKNIININEYTNVPEDKRLTTNKTAAKKVVETNSNFQSHNYYRNNTSSIYVKKTMVPCVFKRTSTLPGEKILELLQEKLDKINTGEFKPTLPEIMNSPVKDSAKEIDPVNLYEEDYMYG